MDQEHIKRISEARLKYKPEKMQKLYDSKIKDL